MKPFTSLVILLQASLGFSSPIIEHFDSESLTARFEEPKPMNSGSINFLHDLPIAESSTPLARRGVLGVPLSPLAPEKAAALGLNPGEGLVLQQPVAGLTADKAGLKSGDIVTKINGEPAIAKGLGLKVRDFKVGSRITFEILREGKTMTIGGYMIEKPRDPGNKNYTVTYSHIVSNGQKMRTIITTPKAPGKYPGFMFIQGFSPVSYDFTLETATGDVASLDGPLLFDYANSGFITIRVEKPGVVDSEGGPFAELDYTTELDIYRQTLKQLKAIKEVDQDNVFIFGHSMGAAFGPMIAVENPVKGIAIYGGASRTWFEYILDTIRYQGLTAGDTFENADETVRQSTRLFAQVFLENKSVEEVKKSHPQFARLADDYFPGGLFNGKALNFWRQLVDTNFASYWSKLDSYVLAVKGQADFVVYEADHKLIADIINQKNPGRGTFAIAPNSDHLFHNFPTEKASQQNFQNGKYSPEFSKMMMKWMKEVMKSPK